jgi:hypothetical protein
MRRRQFLILGLVVLAGIVAGLWLVRRPAATATALRPPTPPAIVEIVEDGPSDEAMPSPSPRAYTIHTETQHVPPAAPEVRPLGVSAAADYRRRARFPAWSHAIEDGIDPIARDREVTPGRSMGEEGRNPTLVVQPQRTTFEAPSTIVLYAYLVRGRTRVDAREMRGEVRSQEGALVATLAFTDDGRAGDAEANDLLFTAALTPAEGEVERLKGAQLVEVRAVTLENEERIATTGFLYSVPKAHLTGRFRDELVDGHLILSAEVTVHDTGRFHLEATLAAEDARPVAWAQNAAVLETGTAWIPLSFWGLTIRESGIDGPYVVRSAALSTTGDMPNQKNDVLERAHVTAAYTVDRFSAAPFGDPDLNDAADRLEADAGFVTGIEAGAR